MVLVAYVFLFSVHVHCEVRYIWMETTFRCPIADHVQRKMVTFRYSIFYFIHIYTVREKKGFRKHRRWFAPLTCIDFSWRIVHTVWSSWKKFAYGWKAARTCECCFGFHSNGERFYWNADMHASVCFSNDDWGILSIRCDWADYSLFFSNALLSRDRDNHSFVFSKDSKVVRRRIFLFHTGK